MSTSVDRFMAQQGFSAEEDSRRQWHFRALQFQPSILAFVVVVGIAFQSAAVFFVLSAILVWNVVFPQWNVFERFYDWAVGRHSGKPRLEPAPAPRRFAQSLAATLMAATGVSLTLGWVLAAYILEVLILIALALLLAGKFCMGSYIFHTLCGRRQFANATCPWSK
jgi:hypothetical protein